MDTLKTKQSHQLIFFGLILFLLGLLVGLFVPMMANPRMGLAAHMQGITNGIFLMVLGLIWGKLILSVRWLRLTFWLVVFGTFANIIAVFIAALTGHGRMMPIAGGKEGTPLSEFIISFLLIALALAMIVVSITVLIGFYRFMKQRTVASETVEEFSLK